MIERIANAATLWRDKGRNYWIRKQLSRCQVNYLFEFPCNCFGFTLFCTSFFAKNILRKGDTVNDYYEVPGTSSLFVNIKFQERMIVIF